MVRVVASVFRVIKIYSMVKKNQRKYLKVADAYAKIINMNIQNIDTFSF